MKNFYQMLEEINPEDENLFSDYNVEIIDRFAAGDYEMALLKQNTGFWPKGLEYHLAISREGMSPVTDTLKKNPINISFLSAGINFFKFAKKLKEWSNLYGDIVIASSNSKKNNIWIELAKKMGFNIEVRIEDLVIGPTKIGIIKGDGK